MKSVTRTFDDAFNGIHKFLLLPSKDTPPDKFGCLSLCVRRKAVKGALQVVERQHTVLALNVLDDFAQMFVLVELGTQHIEAKAKVAYLRSNGIVNQNLALAYVVAVVEESSEDAPAETEVLIVTL